VRLNTDCTLCADSEHFLTLFKESAPSKRILHDEMTELLRRSWHWFVKEEVIQGQPARKLVEIKLTTENCLLSGSIHAGTEAGKLLTEMKGEKSQYVPYCKEFGMSHTELFVWTSKS